MAWIVDGAIISVAFYILYFVAAIPAVLSAGISVQRTSTHVQFPAGVFVAIIVIAVVGVVAPVLYLSVGDGMKRGQTVGKLAMGIAVRDAENNTVIGFWRGLGRTLFNLLLVVLLEMPFLIGNLAPLWDRRRRSWADHVARSVVVDLRP